MYKAGDRVVFSKGEFANRYRDEEGNFAIAVVTMSVERPFDMVPAKMLTGRKAGAHVLFLQSEIEPEAKEIESKMQILKIKRSDKGTGLKVYGEVLGEHGKTYRFGYIRRSNFRGWLCTCDSFILSLFKKNRNCKHIRLVRAQYGRYGQKVN